MPLLRKKHWLTQEFAPFLLQHAQAAYPGGAYPCAAFVRDAIQAITGTDVMPEMVAPVDARAAAALLKRFGGGDLLAAMDAVLTRAGMTKRAVPLMAQRGDPVLVEDAAGMLAAIVGTSGRYAIAPGEAELRNLDIMSVRHAWTY